MITIMYIINESLIVIITTIIMTLYNLNHVTETIIKH